MAQLAALTSRQELEMVLPNLGNQFWGRTTNPASTEWVSKLLGKIDNTYRLTMQGKSKSS